MVERIQDWFDVWEVADRTFAIREPLQFEKVISYLVIGDHRAILVDTGTGVGDIRAIVESLTDLPISLVNSHAHWDHIGGNWRFTDIAIHVSEADALLHPRYKARMPSFFSETTLLGPLPGGLTVDDLDIRPSHATTLLHGGETLDLGGRRLEVIHAPGHSPGGIVLLDGNNRLLFSTDVCYAEAPLYCQLESSWFEIYFETLERMVKIVPEVDRLLPCHGPSPIQSDLIIAMRDAFREIGAGREPDDVDGSVGLHDFGPVSVYVTLDEEGRLQR